MKSARSRAGYINYLQKLSKVSDEQACFLFFFFFAISTIYRNSQKSVDRKDIR
jgi:hypothetical protein